MAQPCDPSRTQTDIRGLVVAITHRRDGTPGIAYGTRQESRDNA